MATLGRIREYPKTLLAIVGLAMAAFIIGDLLTSSNSIIQSSRDKVLEVNDNTVTYEQFEKARQRKSEFLKTMMGQDLNNDGIQQLSQQVYNEFLMKELLDQECSKLGLAVTKNEINDLVQGDKLSPVLQQFFGQQARQVASMFANTITSNSFDEVSKQFPFITLDNWMEIENQIILTRKMEKYTSLISAAIKPNKLEAKKHFEGDNEEVTFAYAKKYSSSVSDSLVKASTNDIKAYYESTKRLYKVAQNRKINYIAVALRPSQADYESVLNDLNSIKEDFSTMEDVEDLVNGNSIVPYVDAYMSMKDIEENFSEEIKDFVVNAEKNAIMDPELQQGNVYVMARVLDKKTAADSIKIAFVMLESEEAANNISNALKNNNVDLAATIDTFPQQQRFTGWVTELTARQNFGKEVCNELFATGKNQVISKSIDGGSRTVYYAAKVLDQTAPVAKAKVAIYASDVTPSTITRRDEYGKLMSFLTECKDDVKVMKEKAPEKGFFVNETNLPSTTYAIGQVSDARAAVRFAFQGKKGEVSEIFECGDNYLVVIPASDIEEGYLSLNDNTFKQQIEAQVLPYKKAEYIAAQMNEASDKSLQGYAQAIGASVDTASFVNLNLNNVMGIGSEPKIIAAALKAEAGKPIIVAGRSVAVALQVIDKHSKNLEYNEEAQLQSVARSRDYVQATNNAFNALVNASEINDNRISFY